jgi:predicted DCC family thiol-disulfide oxidoreductase YuxK
VGATASGASLNTMPQSLILFDGDCAYCNGWVKWITKRDASHKFRFAPLASDEGRRAIAQSNIPPQIDTMVLIADGKGYTRSDAAWRILKALAGYSPVGLLVRAIPRRLRNWGYDLIAKNRHRLGMKDSCEVR